MGASIKNVALLMLFAAAVVGSTAQTTYDVLDSLGWIVPPGGSVAYTTWAANKSLIVGDTLVFKYTTGRHDVAKVTKEAYDNCDATNPISLQTDGPTSIPLDSAGEHYFICTFSSHCSAGQKLAVNVSAAPGSAPAPTTPTPASAPAPAATSTPPPAAVPAPETVNSPSPSPTTSAPPPSPSTSEAPPPPNTPGTPPPTGSTSPPPPGNSATSLKATGLFSTILSVALALLY